jgi:glycosyltransferase involved in cell wall biosynthesis
MLGKYLSLSEIVEIDSQVRFLRALVDLNNRLPYHLLRFNSSNATKRLDQIIESYRPDIVLLEGLPMAIYQKSLRRYDNKIWYRSHNIESDIIHQKAASFAAWNPLRFWMQCEYRKMKAFERQTVRTVDAVLAISPRDLNQLQVMAPEHKDAMLHLGYWPGMVSPAERLTKAKPPVWNGQRPLKLGFIGTMDWLPNQDAVKCLLNDWIPATEGWPNRPEFHIAGRKAPDYFAQNRPAYFFHGEVEDADEFMSSCDAMVFPLRMGSGLKIKVLEAMALGIPVISTAQGVQGMGLTSGENYLHAENADQFARVLKDLIQNPNQLSLLSEKALLKIRNNDDRASQMAALSNLLQQNFDTRGKAKSPTV